MPKKILNILFLLQLTIGLTIAQRSYAQDADLGGWKRIGGSIDGQRTDTWNLQALLYSGLTDRLIIGTSAFLSIECLEFGQPTMGLYMGFNPDIEVETVSLKYVTDGHANYFQDWKMNQFGTGAGLWAETEVSSFREDLQDVEIVEFFAQVPTGLGELEYRARFNLQEVDAVWKEVEQVCTG